MTGPRAVGPLMLGVAAALTAALTLPTTSPANAAAPTTDRAYTVSGSVTAPGAPAIPITGTLTLHVDAAGRTFTGDMRLDPSVTKETVLGVDILVSTAKITPTEPVTGTIAADGSLAATLKANASITSLKLFGLQLLGSGNTCRTSSVATIPLASRPGFSLGSGGTLTGTYTRPPFTDCGLFEPIINVALSGSGNVATTTLTPVQG